MNESRLIDELSAALDETAATVWIPAGAAERARRSARRRRLARGVAASALAGGLAVGLVLATTLQAPAPQAPTRQAGTKPGSHRPAVLTVAYVTSHAKAALKKAADWIVVTRGRGYMQLSDPVTGAFRLEVFRPDGKLASDEMATYNGRSEHRLYVNYKSRTWWELTSKVPVVPKKPDPSGILPVSGNSASGSVRVLGHRRLGGRDTILVKYGPPRGFKPTASSEWATELVWFDAATYLPVRTEITGIGPVEEQGLAYFPATRAIRAKLVVNPPAGFKRVAPPPFRGDGRPGLGQIP